MVSLAELFLCFVTIFGFIQVSDAVFGCYQCADSVKDGLCMTDTAIMMAEYQTWNDTHDDPDAHNIYKYVKEECPSSSDACIIERIEELGQMHAYIRDCVDTSKNYSVYDQRFVNLDKTLNQSTCVYQAGSRRLACVTLCNTHLCNGPQPNGSPITQNNQMYIIFIVTVFMVFLNLKQIT